MNYDRTPFETDKPGEECGVFGAYDFDGHDISSSIYYGLFALQHRGQESCGIAVSDNAIVAIESGCTWNLIGNCTLTSLTNNGTINFNGYTITLADGTVLK